MDYLILVHFRWLASCENELAERYHKIEEDVERLAAKFVNSVEGSDDVMILLSLHTTVLPSSSTNHSTSGGAANLVGGMTSSHTQEYVVYFLESCKKVN